MTERSDETTDAWKLFRKMLDDMTAVVESDAGSELERLEVPGAAKVEADGIGGDVFSMRFAGAGDVLLNNLEVKSLDFIGVLQFDDISPQIVKGLEVNEFSQGKMDATEAELTEERDAVAHLLS